MGRKVRKIEGSNRHDEKCKSKDAQDISQTLS